MKTTKFIIISLLFICISVSSQNDSTLVTSNSNPKTINGVGNNELKINLAMCVAGLPEITYERYIAENMGIGLSASISVDNTQDYNAILLPYYRLYFGNKQKFTFFIEGNMAGINEKNYYYTTEYNPYFIQTDHQDGNRFRFGFGAAAGVKFLTKNNFTGEVYLGAGRIFGDVYLGSDTYPRVGLTIGKRF